MPQNIHHRTITSYCVLPPRIRVIYPEGYDLAPTDRYLREVDSIFERAQPQPRLSPYGENDLVSLVFANQAATHAASSLHLAELILERRETAEKHLADIQWRLDEVLARKPLHLPDFAATDDGKLSNIEKQILDLERQQRDVQLGLWRDLLELRQTLAAERREYRETRNRMAYLAGSDNGGS